MPPEGAAGGRESGQWRRAPRWPRMHRDGHRRRATRSRAVGFWAARPAAPATVPRGRGASPVAAPSPPPLSEHRAGLRCTLLPAPRPPSLHAALPAAPGPPRVLQLLGVSLNCSCPSTHPHLKGRLSKHKLTRQPVRTPRGPPTRHQGEDQTPARVPAGQVTSLASVSPPAKWAPDPTWQGC